jgi:hypothetical protein
VRGLSFTVSGACGLSRFLLPASLRRARSSCHSLSVRVGTAE